MSNPRGRITHGFGNTRLYKIYAGIKTRCYNPNATSYDRYGGRGIAMCDEWVKDFPSFREWALANGYSDSLMIDRVDNDGSYSPDNCRWVTNIENCQNTSRTRLVDAFGETKSLRNWSKDRRCKCNYHTLRRRISTGWDTEKAIGAAPMDPKETLNGGSRWHHTMRHPNPALSAALQATEQAATFAPVNPDSNSPTSDRETKEEGGKQ